MLRFHIIVMTQALVVDLQVSEACKVAIAKCAIDLPMKCYCSPDSSLLPAKTQFIYDIDENFNNSNNLNFVVSSRKLSLYHKIVSY